MAARTGTQSLVQDAVEPYDRRSMTHKVARPASGGRTRFIRRPVARSYDEAVIQGTDYYHPGASERDPQGTIRNATGGVVGYRTQAGWFLYGRKWQDDPAHIVSGGEPLDLDDDATWDDHDAQAAA